MYENEVNIIGLKLAKVLLKELERSVTFRFPAFCNQKYFLTPMFK